MTHIAIDARTFFLRSGVGRYTRGMLSSLASLYPDVELTLFISNQKQPVDIPIKSPNVRVLASAADLNNAKMDKETLFREMSSTCADVMYFPFHILPGKFKAPSVTTIHDLTFIRFPQFHLKSNIDYLSGYLDFAITNASRVVTISNYVRDDVLRYAHENKLNFDELNISMVYQGVDAIFFKRMSQSELSATLQKYNLKKDGFLLYVGSIEPRKNVSGLLKAYNICDTEFPLALVGLERWKPEEYRETVDQLRRKDNIRLLGFVPDNDLPALYRGCIGLIYPSFSEGFGLPVAEAYACGAPVITSNRSSMKEIGAAALMVDPDNVERIRDAIMDFVNDSNLREKLRTLGAQEAIKYTWENCAKNMMAEFEKAINTG